jgi:ferredoxin
MPDSRKDYADCSGCGLCLLVCPVWRRTHDLRFTPHGRAKALQHGAAPADIAASVEACTLCAACVPVCPEEIDLLAMTLDLRRQLAPPQAIQASGARGNERTTRTPTRALLLPDESLRRDPAILARVLAALGPDGAIDTAHDDGADIALALEAGAEVAAPRLLDFLRPLRGVRTLVVADGLLLGQLRLWLPGAAITGLGEALSRQEAVRRGLRAGDLYVIEPRAYHADYQRLVGYYDRLRRDCGCELNLDLQRIAIPATARSLRQRQGREADDGSQARWIMQGRTPARVVVESLEDRAAMIEASGLPVVHLAQLADDGASAA